MIKKAFYLVGTLFFGLFFSACSSAPESPTPVTQTSVNATSTTTQEVPVTATPDLVGTWTATDGNMGMTAKIANNRIQIQLQLGDASGLYWDGTFQNTADDGKDIVSKADVAKLHKSMFGSGDPSKTFKYEDGKLNLGFTMMGVTKNVSLIKKG